MRRPLLALAAVGLALAAAPAAAWADADTTPPDIAFSGPLYDLGVTSSASPEADFSVTDASGVASVQCGVDGGPLADCTSPFQMSALADGIHTLTVKATDASPQHNTNTQSFQFIVDTTPPALDLPSSGVTSGRVSWGYSDADGPVTSTCELKQGTTVVLPAQTCDPSTFTVAGEPDGTYTFTVTVTDHALNSTSKSETLTISSSAPSASITSGPKPVSSVTEPSFAFSASGSTITCKLDGTAVACDTVHGTYSVGSPLADGGHFFEVDADNGGGAIAQAFFSFVVDTTPPSVVIDGSDGQFVNVALGYSASDLSSPALTINCTIDVTTIVACPGGTVDLSSLPEGTHTIGVAATDAAGNVGGATRTIRIDRFAPALTFQNLETGDSTAVVTFTTSDSGSKVTVQCALDGAPLGPCSTSTSFAVTGLAPGGHTITVVAIDEAGHRNTGTATFTITGPTSGGGGGGGGGGGTTGTDTTPPKLTATVHRAAHRRPTLTLRCDERCTVTLTFSRRGRTLARRTLALAANAPVKLILRLPRAAFGHARSLKVTVRLRAVDAAGNARTRTITITLAR